MKDLIILALNKAFENLERNTPKTKKETKYINIEEINPFELSEYLIKNNIPKDVYFGGSPNGYDAFDNVCLCYEIDVPLTQKQIDFRKDERFQAVAFNEVYKSAVSNGYKRKSFNTSLLKDFKESVYKMYLDKDFETLEKYYSLYFEKII